MSVQILPAHDVIDSVKQAVSGNTPLPALVCFDFFDTLVSRSIPPEDTKKLAAEKLSERIDNSLNADEIYQLRSLLEQRLCRENRKAGYDPEFSLTELAGAMAERFRRGGFLEQSSDDQDFINRFIEIELGVEKGAQRPNTDLVDLLKYCHEKGVTTAVLSDFYLGGDDFRDFLAHHGLEDHVDHLFVSADYLMTKGHGGRLYDIAATTVGCRPEHMVMIGDNPHADGAQAEAQGITAYCLKPEPELASSGSLNTRKIDEVLQKNQAPHFAEMGLSLHWFIRRLFLTALADGRTDLLFCSKEGEFLKKLFIRYQELKFGRQVIGSHYLYVSRKATFICSLRPLEQETFDRLFVHYRDLSLSEFLQSLNFSEAQAAEICRDQQLDGATRHFDLKNHADFNRLVNAPSFQDRYERLRQEQRSNFLKYLAHFKLDFKRDGLALVDVGWKGSIQNNIYFALDEQVAVQGYYLGLLSPTEITEKNKKTGILFHDVPVHSDYIHVFNNNRSLFEMMLGASHGSADGYYSAETDGQEGGNGDRSLVAISDDPHIPRVALVDRSEERQLYAARIKPLQEFYARLHDDLSTLTSDDGTGQPLDLALVARKHARMVFEPRSAEVDLFSELYHLENFGLFEFTAFDKPNHISLVQKVKNLWALKRDPAAFLETGTWPPIILRRLGLGFLIPIDGRKRFNRIFGSDR